MHPACVHVSDFTSLWELMAAFLDITLAILYLEEPKNLHRDISYANILLREPGGDTSYARFHRHQFMETLGLSEIEALREKFKCREGLLIDFDYGVELGSGRGTLNPGDQGEEGDNTQHKGEAGEQGVTMTTQGTTNIEKVSGRRTGTPPFIALELLIDAVPHRVVHDLESLFFVLLVTCTQLDGPHSSVANPPLLGNSEHPSPIRGWFTMSNLQSLGYLKTGSMFGHFEERVLKYISPYFNPLKPHLLSWWRALHPKPVVAGAAQKYFSSYNDPSDIINVFKEALLDINLIQELEVRSKR